ncbi:MAG: energy transducer TonB [Verrucomicrobiota bacterium]
MPLPYWFLASLGLHALAFGGWLLLAPATPPRAGVESGPSTMVIRAILSAPERKEALTKAEAEAPPVVAQSLLAAAAEPADPTEQAQPAPPSPAPPLPSSEQTGAIHDRPAAVIVNPAPRYPEAARRARLQGTVEVRLRIDARGNVTGAELVRSSGHLSLDRAALDASSEWRFEPARRAGLAVESQARQRFVFELR